MLNYRFWLGCLILKVIGLLLLLLVFLVDEFKASWRDFSIKLIRFPGLLLEIEGLDRFPNGVIEIVCSWWTFLSKKQENQLSNHGFVYVFGCTFSFIWIS